MEKKFLLLVGELHASEEVAKKEKFLIESLRPDLILYEGFDDLTPNETKDLQQIYRYVNLKNLTKKNKISLSNFFYRFFKDYDPKAYEGSIFRGAIPRNVKKLKTTPIYELNGEITRDIIQYLIEERDLRSLCETNYKICRRIERLREDLEFFKRYRIEGMITVDDLKYDFDLVLRASVNVGAEIAGCDPSSKKREMIKQLKEKGTISEGMRVLDEYVEKERTKDEIEMGRKIYSYFMSPKYAKIIVIVGAYHLREDSLLKKFLEKRKVNYEEIFFIPRNANIDSEIWYAIALLEAIRKV